MADEIPFVEFGDFGDDQPQLVPQPPLVAVPTVVPDAQQTFEPVAPPVAVMTAVTINGMQIELNDEAEASRIDLDCEEPLYRKGDMANLTEDKRKRPIRQSNTTCCS